MSILEQVIQMKNQGNSNDEIITKLQEQRISPKAINDALSQSQIKSAVSQEPLEDMEPSIMEQAPSYQQSQEGYIPKTQEMEEGIYAPQPQQEYSQTQEYYPQESYGSYPPVTVTDTDTMIEISEQVFAEKMKTIQKQLELMNEFRTLSQAKIDSISERLQKIESTIDKLQIAILEKIGSYGQDLSSIKNEMSMMQNSFGKMINPMANRTTTKISKPKTIPKKKSFSRKLK